MVRIVRNRSATLYKTFYADGVAADPTGTPTVTVVRASDGTTVTTGAVTDEPGVGLWSVTIAATANTLLDTLTVTWSGVVNGVAQQYVDYVEVAGGTLFTLSEARAISALTSTTTYPNADVVEMRTAVEQAIEQACARAFVPRYERETLDGSGGATIMLKRPLVTAIRSVTISGTALTAGQLAALSITTAGGVYRSSGWTCGVGNVIVGYEHGSQEAPHEIRRAALMLAKMWLVTRASPTDDRATTFAAAEGGTYSLAVAGRGGSHFGMPDVDAAIDRYSLSVGIA